MGLLAQDLTTKTIKPLFGTKIPGGYAKLDGGSAKPPENPKPGTQGQAAVSPPKVAFPKNVSIVELFKDAAANLGAPRDTLSVTIITFARFFSIPLSPEIMRNLRRDILASSPETPVEKAALEAEAMATIIAGDKGVVLSSDALDRYARFFHFPGERQGEGKTPHKDREENPEAEELKAASDEQEDEFFDLLNSLPGKNGQRWLVIPFAIKVRGTELRVFLRLLREDMFSSGDRGHLIVDVTGPKRQWRCFVKKAGEKFLADIMVFPQCQPESLRVLQSRAEHFLGEGGALPGFRGFDEIRVRNGEEAPSWVEDLGQPSVNEEV